MAENKRASPHVYDADLGPGSDVKSFFESSSLVTQTGFFREGRLYQDLKTKVLPNLLRRKAKLSERLLIWSAGGSDGREAYSIGMTVRDSLKKLNRASFDRVQIRASDISQSQILKGIQGKYSIGEREQARLKQFHDCFEWIDKRTIQMNGMMKRWVDFHVEDILKVAVHRKFDIIICALVLLYYKPSYRGIIIDSLLRSLGEGGYIYLEPVSRIHAKKNGLVPLCAHSHFYQKRGREAG